MEQSRKNLKITSWLVLLLTVLFFVNLISELLFSDFSAENVDASLVLATKILIAVVGLVLMIPQIYVGIKGLRVAKNPNSSKAHIVWAIILFVLTVLSLIEPAVNVVKQVDTFANVSSFCSILVEVVVYFDYIKYARDVAKGN